MESRQNDFQASALSWNEALLPQLAPYLGQLIPFLDGVSTVAARDTLRVMGRRGAINSCTNMY